ncbi:hypothetical protein D3C71_1899030 [compost metagenome]
MLAIAEYAAALDVLQFNRQATGEIAGHGLQQRRTGGEINAAVEQQLLIAIAADHQPVLRQRRDRIQSPHQLSPVAFQF